MAERRHHLPGKLAERQGARTSGTRTHGAGSTPALSSTKTPTGPVRRFTTRHREESEPRAGLGAAPSLSRSRSTLNGRHPTDSRCPTASAGRVFMPRGSHGLNGKAPVHKGGARYAGTGSTPVWDTASPTRGTNRTQDDAVGAAGQPKTRGPWVNHCHRTQEPTAISPRPRSHKLSPTRDYMMTTARQAFTTKKPATGRHTPSFTLFKPTCFQAFRISTQSPTAFSSFWHANRLYVHYRGKDSRLHQGKSLWFSHSKKCWSST